MIREKVPKQCMAWYCINHRGYDRVNLSPTYFKYFSFKGHSISITLSSSLHLKHPITNSLSYQSLLSSQSHTALFIWKDPISCRPTVNPLTSAYVWWLWKVGCQTTEDMIYWWLGKMDVIFNRQQFIIYSLTNTVYDDESKMRHVRWDDNNTSDL